MNLDSTKCYRMPLIMGPVFDRGDLKFKYPQVEGAAFQFLTDPRAIQALLPECYHVAQTPVVTVVFSQDDGLGFMAGTGDRLAAFQVAACFEGETDHVEGDHVLVMFENRTWPIIGGRKELGVPKLFTDISPIRQLPGGIGCDALLRGHSENDTNWIADDKEVGV